MARNTSSLFTDRYRAFGGWAALQGLSLFLLILAMAPPWLPTQLQAVFMQAFAPFCHQLPARMPHFDGTALAVCDRCIGIYGGAVVGIALGGWGLLVHQTLQRLHPAWLIVGTLPAIIDWVGPWLHLWTNSPVSRLGTGTLLGVTVGFFVVAALLPSASSTPPHSSSS